MQYIQGAKRRCRSVNGRFHLKSRSLGSDKGIITRAPGSGESEARRGGHLNTRNSRPDHVNTEAPRHVDKAHPVPPQIKVAQFRDIASTIPSPAFFREHRNARRSTFQPGTRRKSAPLCHCTALIKTRARSPNFFVVTSSCFLIMSFFPGSLPLSLSSDET